MKITLLGTGASAGVPLIGCTCQVCTSNNQKNKRKRVSVLLQTPETTLLIDSSPDLRVQALENNLSHIDAILYTHAHADHTHGIDDLRSFNYLSNQSLPMYANAETIALLKSHFAYAFLPPIKDYGWFRPSLIPHEVRALEAFTTAGISVTPFHQTHGTVSSLGFRIGNFAYSTDVNEMPDSSFDALAGVKTWVVDCLRYSPAPTHAHLDLTLEWIRRVKPQRAILTHMSHDFDYETLAKELPDGVEVGYDGMIIESTI